MQEEVDSRTVAFTICAAKFTGRLFKAAIGKYMAHRKEKKTAKITRRSRKTVRKADREAAHRSESRRVDD